MGVMRVHALDRRGVRVSRVLFRGRFRFSLCLDWLLTVVL